MAKNHKYLPGKALVLTFYAIVIALSCCKEKSPSGSLATYPAPDGVEMNDDFTVLVRMADQSWEPVPVYAVKVDHVDGAKHKVETASMAYFDFEGGPAEVKIISRKAVKSARVRPLSCNITPQISGKTIRFSLDGPGNLSVETNGDIFHNLHLFAGPIPERPDSTDTIFTPGLHSIGDYSARSSETIYLEGGAVLDGVINVEGVEDVTIKGRGIIRPQNRRGAGIVIARSRNITVDGPIVSQCPVGESDSVRITDVKSITHFGWGDGLNVFASSNVAYDRVFCRNSDDCTTIYCTRLGYKGSCRNISMRHSTLWADVAHPIEIGLHGNPAENETIRDVLYSDIDILDHREKQIDYQGCMSITSGDNVLVDGVRFENIRIEDFRQGALLRLRVCYNPKYCSAPGRGIRNITFKDVSYNGSNSELSLIAGYDEERDVSGISFENLNINGETICDKMPGKPAWYRTWDMARIFVGEHASGITFR